VKTDKVDAHILAQLLRLDFIPEVAMVDEETWTLRQLVSHQRSLGKQRVALRNRIRSLLNARLLHCPFVDLFGAAGRRWLKSQPFMEEEQTILETTLQLHDALQDRVQILEAALQQRARGRLDAKLLMTIPGVNVTVAIGLMAAIGDIQRFPTPGELSSYFGLVPRVHQSADRCYHGRITKAGRSHARWLAIEAAQSLAQSTSPLAATYHRVRRKKGHNVAVTALARKLIVLVWHMLTHAEPYRYAPVARTRQKLRRVTPGIGPAGKGQVPRTLEAVYAEAGLPRLAPPTAGERRMKARNLRTVTMARRTSPLRRDSMGTMAHPLQSVLEESTSGDHRTRGREPVRQS